MAMSHQRADNTLDTALRGGATPHICLHTGDPGAAGTGNVAMQPDGTTPIVRKAIAFDAPGNHATNTERRCLSSGAVSWAGADINSGQEITHFSIWSAVSGGQPEFVAAVTTPKTTGSDGVSIGAGDVEVAISVFAKP